MLKDRLVSLNIIVREVELGKEFQFGEKGFNVLVRDRSRMLSTVVSEENYAVVGTYSITSKSLNLFIKLFTPILIYFLRLFFHLKKLLFIYGLTYCSFGIL